MEGPTAVSKLHRSISLSLAPLLVAGLSAPALAATDHRSDASAISRTSTVAPNLSTSASSGVRSASAARTPFVSRTTAHPYPVKDAKGQVWAARSVGYGTWNRSDGLAGKDIAGTRDDALYRANAWGIRWYWVNVPAKATYTVRILLAEDFWSARGKRVFDIKAEGRLAAAKVDIVRAAGRARAYEVSFPVTVSDGRLDLDFVARADNPLISAVEVRSTTSVPAASPSSAAQVRLSPSSFYRQKVTKAPLASNSARTVALLAKYVADNWGGSAAFNAYQYNSPVYTVPANQPKVRVAFDDCQKKGYTPANLFSGRGQFLDVPVPANAVPAKGTDGEMSIYDPAADKLWEFWQMRRTATGWSACWGGRIDKLSTSQPIFTHPYGATATGIALAGGMVTATDIRRGRIDHAIPVAVIGAARFDRFSWPANRSDGNSTLPDAVLEGQRLRLDPKVKVDSLDLTPIGQMVARAAQEYGFVVVDKGGAVAVIAESGEPEKARTGSNPWDRLLGGSDSRALRNFPWNRMQAIRPNYGRP